MSYQSEKFHQARRNLMLPHPKGEAAAVAHAFLEIDLALHSFDESTLDDYPRSRIARLRQLMDTSSVPHGSETGGWQAKAKGFSVDEKSEVSNLVDELASWFGGTPRP
jgi:hypothetical protein